MQKFRIDLFSDTNCLLSEGMRQAMTQAEVGNEVAGEDPTINTLLKTVCNLLGKEAAIFLPSGMMCNAISFLLMSKQGGNQIIIHKTAHPVLMSGGVISGLARLTPLFMNGPGGMFTAKEVEDVCHQPQGRNIPRISGLSVEQPTNFGGGRIWPLTQLQQVAYVAKKFNILTHMDGARLFNAVVATGISPATYAQYFDLVWIDFAKGLGAPMGAVLAGSTTLIEDAWYYKFQLGGGLHKAGILGAACLYALEHNLSQLGRLNELAKHLAQELQTLPYIEINPREIETNIVFFKIKHPQINTEILHQELLKQGIRLHVYQGYMRAITHLDTTTQDIEAVIQAIKVLLAFV